MTNHVEQQVEGPDGQRRTVMVHLGESPLSWLHARVTMRWDAAPREGGRRGPGRRSDPTLAQLSARERFDGAIGAAGPGLADILWRVACAGEGLVAAEKALGWPSRAGKLVLTLALDRVASWYRVP